MAKAWVSRDALPGGESHWGVARTVSARIWDYSQRYPAPPREPPPRRVSQHSHPCRLGSGSASESGQRPWPARLGHPPVGVPTPEPEPPAAHGSSPGCRLAALPSAAISHRRRADGLQERKINRKGEALGCFSAGSQGRRPRGVEWHPVTVAPAASPRPACHPRAKPHGPLAHPPMPRVSSRGTRLGLEHHLVWSGTKGIYSGRRGFDLRITFCSPCRTHDPSGSERSEARRALQFENFLSSSEKVMERPA